MTEPMTAPEVAALQKQFNEQLHKLYHDMERRQRITHMVLEHAAVVLKPEEIVKLVIDLHRFITLPSDIARSAEVVPISRPDPHPVE